MLMQLRSLDGSGLRVAANFGERYKGILDLNAIGWELHSKARKEVQRNTFKKFKLEWLRVQIPMKITLGSHGCFVKKEIISLD